jgi:hypothetical protein
MLPSVSDARVGDMVHRLGGDEVRRIAIHGQLLDLPRPTSSTT